MNPVRVRRIVSALCIMNASLAAAQSPPASPQPPAKITLRGAEIPMGEAGQILYQLTTGADGGSDNSSMASRLQKQLQIDDATFQALLAHMRTALDEIRSFEGAQQGKLCARRPELTTNQKLGDALQDNERQLDARRELLMQGAESILGAGGKARLDAAIADFRRGMVVSRTNYAVAMAAEKREPAALLTSMCSNSSGIPR